LEALALGWADETEALGVKVNLFDPGGTRTGMRAEAKPGEDPMTLPTPESVAEKILPLLSPAETRTGQLFRARAQSQAIKLSTLNETATPPTPTDTPVEIEEEADTAAPSEEAKPASDT